MTIGKICVYCASSTQIDPVYLEAARQLGTILARNSFSLVYGAGGVGSMGALADGALAEGGNVIGVIPRYMKELGWARDGLSELRVGHPQVPP